MRSTYLIKLELLFDSKIKVERVNLFGLKFNPSITLIYVNFFATSKDNNNKKK